MKSRAEVLADMVDSHAAAIEDGSAHPLLDGPRLRALADELRSLTSRDLLRAQTRIG